MKKTNIKKRSVKKPINFQEKILSNLLDSTKYRAIIYEDNGDQIAIVPIKRHDKKFNWNGRSYITDFEVGTGAKIKSVFSKYKYFYYNVNNPFPMCFNKENNNIETPAFDTESLDIMLETKVIKDLNNVNKKLFANLDMKTVLIILGIIVAGIYFLKGGTLA